MRTRLIQFEQRVAELEQMAEEVLTLAEAFSEGQSVRPKLSIRTHTWYFAAHGLMEKLYPEKVEWLENCYDGSNGMHQFANAAYKTLTDWFWNEYRDFQSCFATARGLVVGSLERLKSLEYDVFIQLSTALVSDEFETARQLFDTSRRDESILRAAGTVGRVALERHIFTVAESRNVTIEVNPPTKKKAEAQDVLNSLEKAGAITKIQKSELESLFRIGNTCAHPKESIKTEDIERLIQRGKELTATIV